jgi:hypothetical protein
MGSNSTRSIRPSPGQDRGLAIFRGAVEGGDHALGIPCENTVRAVGEDQGKKFVV